MKISIYKLKGSGAKKLFTVECEPSDAINVLAAGISISARHDFVVLKVAITCWGFVTNCSFSKKMLLEHSPEELAIHTYQSAKRYRLEQAMLK